MEMYTQGIAQILAEPKFAADTGPIPDEGFNGSLGKNGAKWLRTATGPTPGPPPPCGIQNVL